MWGSHTLRNGPSSSKVVAVVEASPLSLLGTTGQGCLWQQGKAITLPEAVQLEAPKPEARHQLPFASPYITCYICVHG